jgi:hypothetical protein
VSLVCVVQTVVGLLFGSLQAVQDGLDDPFDGISEDDIDFHSLYAWAPDALWYVGEITQMPHPLAGGLFVCNLIP